jgi:putative endonuclease
MTNSRKSVLYTGVTNDLIRRVQEHKDGIIKGFAQKYKCHRLVFFESTDNINAAIEREKQIKAGSRSKKIELIESINPNWRDLSDEI